MYIIYIYIYIYIYIIINWKNKKGHLELKKGTSFGKSQLLTLSTLI